jgi:mycoredoxin
MTDTEQGGNATEEALVVYGTAWCSAAVVVRTYLERDKVAFRWLDIDADAEARAWVMNYTGGYASVPTLRFPDGEVLVEPALKEVQRKLGLDDDRGPLDRLRAFLT